jgi:nucleotide-binding universal stress UspA family protein
MEAKRGTIGTVVCATDFSPTAELALRQAAGLARKHAARLVLAHAMEPLPAEPYPMPMAMPIEEAEIREQAGARLEALADGHRDASLAVDTYLEMGDPGRSLVDLCERVAADLCVIGTRGLTGLKHLLLGSTAEYVVRRARCPVLTIHPDDRAEISEARSVVVPTDLSGDSSVAVAAFLELFTPEDMPNVQLVFADSTPPYFEYMTHERLERYHQEDARREEIEQQMAPLVADFESRGFTVEKRVLDGPAVEAITDLAEKEGADLILMSTHGRSAIVNALLGRTAQRVVQHAPCPVLTVCPRGRRKVGEAAE